MFIRTFSLVFTLGSLYGPVALWSQPAFTYTKVLDNGTLRPDRNQFKIGANATPAFDGQWVVFRDYGTADDGSLQAIFSFNTVDRTFHTLVNLHTAVPGGATFTELHLLDTAPAVRNGIVIFLARNTAAVQYQEGLYSVPVAGGAITRIADYKTADPTGGDFELFDSSGLQSGGFAFDGTTLAFHGQGPAGTGIYSAKADGSSLGLIADSLHPWQAQGAKVLHFSSPLISGANVVMSGTDASDPATGYNGLYLGKVAGGGALVELLNSNQPLPGAGTPFHTRFDVPYMGFDGNLVAFRAEASSALPAASVLYGLYRTDLITHTITTIADVNSTLPGLGRLRAIADGGVAVSQGNVLFRAGDNTPGYPGNSALFMWSGTSTRRIIGTADKLDGNTVQVVHDPAPAALAGSAFTFVVEFGQSGNFGIYVATPVPGASPAIASVNNAASYAASSVAPGEIVALFGSDLGPAALTRYVPDTNNRIPASLAGTTIFFNGTPAPVIYTSESQAAAVAPFELAGQTSAQVVLQYNGNSSAPFSIPVTNTMPGLFSADSSGAGPGAIQNADMTANASSNPAAVGSIVTLWLSGLGMLNPAPANGAFVPAANIPTLQFSPTVTIGGKTSQIIYAGPGPLSVAGLYQINCTIPIGVPPGLASLAVTADGRQSQENLTVFVK